MLERDNLTPRQVETVGVILDNTRHLVRLLNDLLDLARSDAGAAGDPAATDRGGAAARGFGAADACPDRRGRSDSERKNRPRPASRRSKRPTGSAKFW